MGESTVLAQRADSTLAAFYRPEISTAAPQPLRGTSVKLADEGTLLLRTPSIVESTSRGSAAVQLAGPVAAVSAAYSYECAALTDGRVQW